jgi:aldehyde dehydrogenase (NAD+)
MTDTANPDTAAATPTTDSGAPVAAVESYAELVDGLRRTFRSGHTRPMEWRKSQLRALIALINENEGELLRALKEDLGKPAVEAFGSDLGFTRTEIKHILKHVDGWAKPTRAPLPVTALPGKGRFVHEPLGVALVIAPWNYPVQLLLSPMAAAIAAGNCVVAKPSELAPATSAVLARLIPKYLDDKAIVCVEGGVPETTALLDLQYDHVFFTGSTNVGRVVMQAAAKHLTPVTLELGGKSPVIVASDHRPPHHVGQVPQRRPNLHRPRLHPRRGQHQGPLDRPHGQRSRGVLRRRPEAVGELRPHRQHPPPRPAPGPPRQPRRRGGGGW